MKGGTRSPVEWCKGVAGVTGGHCVPLHDRGDIKPFQINALPGHGDLLIGGDKDRTTIVFRQIEGMDGEKITVLRVNRRKDNHRQSAAVAPAKKLNISVRSFGGRAGRRPQPLDIDDNQTGFLRRWQRRSARCIN